MTNPKRRSARIKTTLPVRWVRYLRPIDGEVTDINMHGLFIRTPAEVNVGELMQLQVQLPDGALTLFAVSRFVGVTRKGRGIGVEIYVIDPIDHHRWLQHYDVTLARAKQGRRGAFPESGADAASNLAAGGVKIVAPGSRPSRTSVAA
jgi:hypothetical protein